MKRKGRVALHLYLIISALDNPYKCIFQIMRVYFFMGKESFGDLPNIMGINTQT